MQPFYNVSYTKEKVGEVLCRIKTCVQKGKFTISLNKQNRVENVDFINAYNIDASKRMKILEKITPEDFCHSLNNTNPGYEHEILYVFAPTVELFNVAGACEKVKIYTKFNIIKREDGDFAIVISFHKLNRPINYLFK